MAADAKYAFAVAVLGARDGDPLFADAEYLARLLQLLVNRHRDDRQIWIVSAGADSPDVAPVAAALNWTLLLEPCLRDPCRQDHAILALAHAVVVLGDARPWARLLRLAQEARIPTRVYERPPRLPRPRSYPTS